MNLADAIRKAAHEVGSGRTSLLEPAGLPVAEVNRPDLDPLGYSGSGFHAEESPPDPPDVSPEDGRELRVSASGNVVRLEIFMTPEQMNSMLRAIMTGQHSVLTAKEAAAYLRTTPAGLEKLAELGEIPAVEIEGRWRFHKHALDDWMLKQAAKSAIEPESEDSSDAA